MKQTIINTLGWLDNPNPALSQPGEVSAVDLGEPEIDGRALRDAHASGLTAIHTTIGYVAGPADPFAQSVAALDMWDRVLAAHGRDLCLVRSSADLQRASDESRIGVILGFQNSVMLGDDAGRVDLFAARGVRVIQLTYNMRNAVGDGSACAENRGLTQFGRDVVERLNAARVIVDLSHSGEATCVEAIRHSSRPVAITHTGCRALADLPRNKSDEELRLLAERGGFVGIYFMPFLRLGTRPGAADVVAHIEHAVQVCGEDHVGIGTDGTVTPVDDLDLYRSFVARQIEARRTAGIGAAGENADSYTFVEDLRGVDQFRRLAELLRGRGHSAARIDKILGGNFARFAAEIWG